MVRQAQHAWLVFTGGSIQAAARGKATLIKLQDWAHIGHVAVQPMAASFWHTHSLSLSLLPLKFLGAIQDDFRCG